MNLLTKATGIIDKLPKLPITDLVNKLPMGNAATDDAPAKAIAAPAASEAARATTNDDPCKPKEITTEEKKDQVRDAYRKIIMEQKDVIISEFKKALDSYLKLHFKEVDNNDLKQFIQDTLFSQMKEFFHNVNKSYVQYTIIRQIFLKHSNLFIPAITQSVLSANIDVSKLSGSVEEYTNTILQGFKKELDELDMQQQIIRGGSDADRVKIGEIANWFPIELDKNEVNSDIAYVVKESFQEIMNEDRTLAKTIDAFLVKDIFPIIQKQMENYIGNQDIRVDLAILRAYLDLPESQNIIYYSVYDALQQVIFDRNSSINANTLAVSIYDNIMTRSISEDKRRAYGGRKTRRTNKKRKSKTRQNKKSRK